MKTYIVGGDGKISHAVDPDFLVVIGDTVKGFPLCRRPRRLVTVWDQDYDPDDGCVWCNRKLEKLNGGG